MIIIRPLTSLAESNPPTDMNIKDVIEEYGGRLSSADELYAALFRLGEHEIEQTSGPRAKTTYKGNPIIYLNDKVNFSGSWKRYILLEDTALDQIHEAQKCPSNLLNGCTYYGKKKESRRMDKCFGLIFDLDDVDERCITNLLFQCRNGICAMPNYIVISKSGKGVHLYYTFDRPLRMYPNIKVELKELKYTMTKYIWNDYTSNNKNVQFQSFDQSFMIAGSTAEMIVYELNKNRWSVDELADIYHYSFNWDKYRESRYTKEEAKEKFPDWYEAVVVRGEKRNGRWTNKRDLYDWWIRQLKAGAVYGTRYWCVMCLVIYGVKCDIPKREVKKDIYDLLPLLNAKAPEHPFTEGDIKSALEAYDQSFVTFPIKDISRLSKIEIQKNRRNGLPQELHLSLARERKAGLKRAGRVKDGRPPEHKKAVEEYFKEHPKASITDCAVDLNIARSTVYRWRPVQDLTKK